MGRRTRLLGRQVGLGNSPLAPLGKRGRGEGLVTWKLEDGLGFPTGSRQASKTNFQTLFSSFYFLKNGYPQPKEVR